MSSLSHINISDENQKIRQMVEHDLAKIGLFNKYLQEIYAEENLHLLNLAAGAFFLNIKYLLREAITIRIARLFDESKDRQGNQNISLFLLIDGLCRSSNINQYRITELEECLQKFKEHNPGLFKIRRKRIAHKDKPTNFTIESDPENINIINKAIIELFKIIQNYPEIFFGTVDEEIFYIDYLDFQTDSQQLLTILKKGLLEK